MKKLFNYLAWTVILSTIGIIVYIVFVSVYPFKVVKITQPVTVLTKDVKRGDSMTYKITYCRYFKGPMKVSRYLLSDTSTITYSEVISPYNPSASTCGSTEISLAIPENAKPGRYHLVATATAVINSIRTIPIPFYSEEFNIY